MWPWLGSMTQASQHGNSSWSRSLKPCDQSFFFKRISCPNFAACQHSLIYVQQCQYQENVEWQSSPQMFSCYPSIRGCNLSHVGFSVVEQHYGLCVGHFQLLNFFIVSVHTVFNRSQVTCCTLVIHHKPGGTHIYFVRLSPHPTPTPCKLGGITLIVW